MSVGRDDLGVLGNLAVALGLFDTDGQPNAQWFGDPGASLKNMLASPAQRAALIAFVDEAMGGADRTTEAGVIWLPIVDLDEPPLTLAVTVDESRTDGLHIGVGLRVRTTAPVSSTMLALPLFRTQKDGGPAVTQPLLLGSPGGRIRIATAITIDSSAHVPGTARLGGIGLEIDVPTSDGDGAPLFALSLTGFALPGAAAPRDLRVAADGTDALDDALLELVLSLVKSQADAAPAGSPIAAIGGLLGLRSADAVPDFPIAELPQRGAIALADWARGILTQNTSRADWLQHLAALLGGTRVGDAVQFALGAATLALGLRVDSGASGNATLVPSLAVELGDASARVEARADLMRIDLVTGAAFALPQLGLWAAAGRAGQPVLDVATAPVVRADTLRLGFALDAQRRLTFVLAADGVTLGTRSWTTLDLSSPGAVMDAAGSTVEAIADQLLAGLGNALAAVRQWIGLAPPAGIAAVTLPALMADPMAAIAGYWQQLVAQPAAMRSVLGSLRAALADATQAGSAVPGAGTAGDPWRLVLIDPLQIEVVAVGSSVTFGLGLTKSIDTFGQRCTVVDTRIAAQLARIDLAARRAVLLPAVEAVLSARERGVAPARARLQISDDVALAADHVGLRLAWSPATRLAFDVNAPNLRLQVEGNVVPIALPVIAPDGSVTLPPAAWDGVQALVGHIAALVGGFLERATAALGWDPLLLQAGGETGTRVQLRLADLIADADAALRAWLPRLLMSDVAPRALTLLADLFKGHIGQLGFVTGTGHPDDPYRFDLHDALPNVALWFPPEGLEPKAFAAPEALRAWRPGDDPLAPDALQAALRAEAGAAAEVRALIDGRDLAGGLAALSQRWLGGDGRIVPPATAPAGITLRTIALSARQLVEALDLEDLIGRVPTTTVHVAIGAAAWPDAPAERRIDLGTPGLDAAMLAPPALSTGDWFVALGARNDCRASGSASDGTPEQAARLARVLDATAAVGSDIVLVAIGGAGHAARVAAQAQTAVSDLVLVGTPLAAISLSALAVQPTADALRLLHRLLPPLEDEAPDDDDLALGRGLVAAMMELTTLADPGIDLRPATASAPSPRAGLNTVALFGEVSAAQIGRAITAIVAAGLAGRARDRAAVPLPPPSGVNAGLRWQLPPSSDGTLAIQASATLSLFSYALDGTVNTARVLRVQCRLADRLGWLVAAPEMELRAVSVDLTLPLDDSGAGSAQLVLHDARVFGLSAERLVLGDGSTTTALLPEARVLLAAAMQRLQADLSSSASLALWQLLNALGLTAPSGGIVGDAWDQWLHDPAGLVRTRLAAARAQVQSAIATLLGAPGLAVDLATGTVRLQGGDADSGRFGWRADVTVSATGLAGFVVVGADDALQARADFNGRAAPQLALHWHHAGGRTDSAPLWPQPDALPIARMLAQAAPSLAGHVALEVLRRADATTRPMIDALLDALGLLAGSAADAQRALRPLAGLIADPAGWLSSRAALATDAARVQRLLDTLRPLMALPGPAGDALEFAAGVHLAVAADGGGVRLALAVDPTAWTAAAGVAERVTGAVGASLRIAPSAAPQLALDLHVGLPDAPAPGRQAVHLRLGGAGVELFLRPTTGADIVLVPFAGLGVLSGAAQAAFPFLLDKLSEVPGPVGQTVGRVGDALALRDAAAPPRFQAAALTAWATDPVAALTASLPSIVATGLQTIAPLLDTWLPAGVTASGTPQTLDITIAGVTVTWRPAAGAVRVAADSLAVPGIETLGFGVAISAAGLDELSLALGPATIDAGGALLRPFVQIAAGNAPPGGRRVAVGLAVDGTSRFAARWTLDAPVGFALVASNGAFDAAIDTIDPGAVALRAVEVVADLVAAVAMAQDAVADLLDTDVRRITARNLLRGVLLADTPNPATLIANLFDPDAWLPRLHQLFKNIAGANGNAGLVVPVGDFTFSLVTVGGQIGLQVGVTDRFTLLDTSDVTLWLENDDAWITDNPAGDGGLFVGVMAAAGPLLFKPSLAVNGLGLRIGKSSGPLLEAGLTLESIALHVFARIDGAAPSGGVQLQFANLAVPAGNAGGTNPVAQGVMRDTGPTPPQPSFSPSLAIQKHGAGAVQVSLRAGEGDGPWWIAIQRGFGPLYLEQIGFGATMPGGRLERVSLLMDGSVSMFGLTCAVDDLQITYFTGNGNFFEPGNWSVDLAGLAVSADMAGVSLAGGLLKQGVAPNVEYLGMLLGRFAVYGLTVYGGYGQGKDPQTQETFTAFFAIGAVNGPIGGPPAFFLTGIGGGFGINRQLVLPADLGNFGDYPLIQALDVAASPSDPMTQLRALGTYFPMKKGTFWFAAGLSFNSFALVDGIAVVGVQIGDGLDINLLGLARMALPRPQVALVSIELALLVRFSSSEGVLWVQAQLTDNSWLLYPDIRLTGGFAYVIWFKGEKAGEFVLTMGGYHPDFHRDGYPVVPRLGLRWSIGDAITIKAGSYFALTSEALMAGGDFEASAKFGPAWAEVKFGAHGIVYFDPFAYQVNAYARIAAGVTIDTWLFGEVTFSIHIGARIDVQGPDFRGRATFEVGPIELTVAFGGSDRAQRQPIAADAFIAKYLEAADSGKARPHALMTDTGTLPSQGDKSTPDGSSTRPFVVVVEFSLTMTSSVPASAIRRTLAPATITLTQHPPSRALGVAPMDEADVAPEIVLTWTRGGVALPYPFVDAVRPFGRFPVGIWGPPQDDDNRKVPKAEMIEALSELSLVCEATPSVGGPEIAYHQVDIGPRKPLPFARSAADVALLRTQAGAVTTLVAQPADADAAFARATQFLGRSASPTALAALRGERQAPPRTGSLTEGLESPTATVVPVVATPPPGKVYDHFIDAPVAVGLLSGATLALSDSAARTTTVKGSQRAWRVAPPSLAEVMAERSRSVAARLVLSDDPAQPTATRSAPTLIAARALPPTAAAQAAPAVVARSGAPLASTLAAFDSALTARARGVAGGTARARAVGAELRAGQIAVMHLPNAHADVEPQAQRPQLVVAGAPARVVLLGHGGKRLADRTVGPGTDAERIEIVRGTRRIVAVAQGSARPAAGLAGWHAGLALAYAGHGSAIGPGCVVHAVGDALALHRERQDAGWVQGAELARGESTVTTTFGVAARCVLIALDDPAAAGDPLAARQLLLGLDGATRALDVLGFERAPVLLAMDNRSVLAYDVVPEGDGTRAVVVTIASQADWSLVGVMASATLDATAAVALLATRGFDAALAPLAGASAGADAPPCVLAWDGAARSDDERAVAHARARGAVPPAPRRRTPQPARRPAQPRGRPSMKGRR